MKTYQPKERNISRRWHLFDVREKILGRIATEISGLLIGKHKPDYAPHMDMGDYVVVINAKGVKMSGKKEQQKTYKKHSGYPGGFKEVKYKKLLEDHPEKIIEHAVSGMLPKNRLHQKRINRLKVFPGVKHTYEDKFRKTKT